MEKLAIYGGKPVSEQMIPLAKPFFSEKTINDVSKVLRSGYVTQGPKVNEFEEKFRDRVGARYAYTVSSGTAALHVSFLSILRPGDEVIVPAFTFFATASTVLFSKGRPIFVDIDPETFLIDQEDVKEKITKKTRAIAPVHLFGNAADMNSLLDLADEYNILIVSDSAQAHGTEICGRDIGSLDHMNCYSFYPSKSMTTAEGGIVTTNNKELYKLGCLVRSHGDDEKHHHVMLGLNYRMTEIAAVIGLNQLSELDDFLKCRRSFGKILRTGIERMDGLHPQKIVGGANHSYSYFTVVMDLDQFNCTRDEFLEALGAENIASAVHYPTPLTKQPAILNLMKPEACPISEETSRKIFSLPMHSRLTDEELTKILAGVEKIVNHFHK